jgi:hypothetical protein
LQELMGHASVTITLQTCSHVLPSMHDDAATTVAQLVTAASDPKVTRLRAVR